MNFLSIFTAKFDIYMRCGIFLFIPVVGIGHNKHKKGDVLQKAQNKEAQSQERCEETPRQILALMLAYVRYYSLEGDVEKYVAYAKVYLGKAGLTFTKRIVVNEELGMLLLKGYEAEAWNCLEDAKFASKVTDVSDSIAKMHLFLGKAGLELESWLKDNDSSLEELESVQAQGIINKEIRLQTAKAKNAERGSPKNDSLKAEP